MATRLPALTHFRAGSGLHFQLCFTLKYAIVQPPAWTGIVQRKGIIVCRTSQRLDFCKGKSGSSILGLLLLLVPLAAAMSAWAGDPDPAELKLAVDRTAAAARSAAQDLAKKRAAAKTAGQAYITAAEKSAMARAQIAANEPLLSSSDKEVVAKATIAISEAYLVREAETTAKEAWQRAEAEVKRAANVVAATMTTGKKR